VRPTAASAREGKEWYIPVRSSLYRDSAEVATVIATYPSRKAATIVA
jgi:hypothetical protein